MTELLEDLRRAAAPAAPKDFTPGVQYVGAQPVTITTPAFDQALETEAEWIQAVRDMGVPLPEGKTLELVEARYDEAGWTRSHEGADALTKPVWRYRFKVVDRSMRADEDLATLFKEARRVARSAKRPAQTTEGTTLVINLADFQGGKVDDLGGTPELLLRNAAAKEEILARARKQKPAQIVLVDPGDSMEMFESAPNAARTNDLQFTEQIRVWRRMLWSWVADLAPLTEELVLLGVPSNHCRVRQGKNTVGPQNDDLGLEVLSQIHDLVGAAGLDHVKVMVPHGLDEYLSFTLAGGRVLGVVHGHQKSKPELVATWVQQQGRRPIGQADIVVAGHFHHLRIETFGDNQWLFVCPTMDNGSAWYRNTSGNESRPGVLTFMVDSQGWRDLHVAWTA